MSTASDKQKTWSIPDQCLPFVKEKCSEGLFIFCSVCKMYDDDGISYAKIMMRNNVWSYRFQEHVCSTRHKDNCLKQAMRREAERRGQTSRRKRLQQSILPFATSTPSRLQIREQIVGEVPPSIAGGENSEAQSVLTDEKIPYCNGLLAKKISLMLLSKVESKHA